MHASRHAAPQVDRPWTVLTVLLATVAPFGVIASLSGQVERTGNVSHWPWEEYGVWGWWAVPLSFWLAAASSSVRPARPSVRRTTFALLLVAALTTLSLLWNP